MTSHDHDFDETLLSGHVDGELTQAEAQRVRVHLQDCVACREFIDQATKLKEATMGSEFQVPRDVQWDETPRSGTSRLLRNAGVVIGLAWLLAAIGWVIVELAGSEDILGLVLVGGFVVSAALVLASVYLDRREASKTDRYRRVDK